MAAFLKDGSSHELATYVASNLSTASSQAEILIRLLHTCRNGEGRLPLLQEPPRIFRNPYF